MPRASSKMPDPLEHGNPTEAMRQTNKKTASLDGYYEPGMVFLPFDQLKVQTVYRLVHADGVASMKDQLLQNGFSPQHPLIVKRTTTSDEDPNNLKKFIVVDGMHRVTAMREIVKEHGQAALARLLRHSTQGLPCLIVRHDTPEYLLTGFASRSNESNMHFTPMSFMDSALNIAKFAMAYAQHEALETGETVIWVTQPVQQLFSTFNSTASWSDFQKKMGIVSYCCLKQDAEALMLEPLAYRNGEPCEHL